MDPVGDLDDLFAIFNDPAGWRHDPDGRHLDRETTRRWLQRAAQRWRSDGLSYWTVRLEGEVIGVGGVQRQRTGDWNLHYRIASSHHGRGHATELARAACAAAAALDPCAPVIAWIAPENLPSRRVAERLGFVDTGLAEDPSDGRVRIAFRARGPAGCASA